jgi:3-deoxy-D-manno-octulosonic-acid transferase
MDDFIEISTDLLEKKAAIVCHDEEEIVETLKTLLVNVNLRDRMGEKAQSLVLQHRGVTKRHLEIIQVLLNSTFDQPISS